MKNNSAFKFLIPLIELITFVSCGFIFSNTNFVQKSAELSLFANECKKNNAKYCYVNIDVQNDKRNSVSEAIFSNTYSENFSGTSTKLMTVSNETDVASFETSFNNEPIPFLTSVVSSKNYSNDEELLRLETVCLNIYKYRPRQEEHYYDSSIYDGFIYIPDYYADYIIDTFCPGESYDDLLLNEDLNYISLASNLKCFKYKIANIFHVNGFNSRNSDGKQFKYNDLNTGKILDDFFNGFCFVSNYGHFSNLNEELHTTIFCEFQPKRYMLDETLTMAAEYKNVYKANSGKATVYYYANDSIKRFSSTDKMSTLFFEGGENYGFLVFGIALTFVNYVALITYSYIFRKTLIDKVLMISLTTTPIILLIISFVLKAVLHSRYIYTFFNPITLIATAINFALTCLIIGIVFIKKKGENI